MSEKHQISDSYSDHDKMYVAIDCIIFGFDSENLKLLIFKRRMKPHVGKWSLIGSFVKLTEDVGETAKRVLKEITGLTDVFMEELKTYGNVERDPGYRCISIGQYALIRIDDYDQELVKKHGAHWYNVEELPDLVFDHNQMVHDALERIKRKARNRPIGFELLPEKFTIPQLQRLYEAIYQTPLDDRNFRKKILSLNVLEKLNEKDKSNSRRGAFLYKFDDESYQRLLEENATLDLF